MKRSYVSLSKQQHKQHNLSKRLTLEEFTCSPTCGLSVMLKHGKINVEKYNSSTSYLTDALSDVKTLLTQMLIPHFQVAPFTIHL